MANTLTNLIPELYTSLDVVSRELVGMIPSVTIDATTSRAALNQTVRNFVAPASTAADITPGLYAPDSGNQTIGNTTLTISKSRMVPIRWNGEEELSMGGGFGASNIRSQQIQQAMRTLVNEIETDLCALQAKFSRAAGAAGTAPFGTAGDYTAASLTRKILADNGAPLSDLKMVLNTTAGANIRGKQATNAGDPSGSATLLRQGVLLDINGLEIRESAQVVTSTAGTMSGGSTTGTHAVGATVLALKNATGTGTVSAGDIITIAGDTNQYVVTSAAFAGANPATGDTITIAAPGLRVGFTADKVITVVAAAARNMAFSRSAIVLAHRLPALPANGDAADDRVTVTDPRSGLSFEISAYRQYRQVHWEVACAWGVACVKPEHTALLLG